MLGIIIGVWSVISALALAAGVKQSITASMSALGTNLLTVTPGQNRRVAAASSAAASRTLKVERRDWRSSSLAGVGQVAAGRPRQRGQARNTTTRTRRTSLSGTGPAVLPDPRLQAVASTAAGDDRRRLPTRPPASAVLGPTTAKTPVRRPTTLTGVGQDDRRQRRRLQGRSASSPPRATRAGSTRTTRSSIPYTTAMTAGPRPDVLERGRRQRGRRDEAGRRWSPRVTLLLRRRHHLGRRQALNDFNVRSQTEILAKSAADIQFFLSGPARRHRRHLPARRRHRRDERHARHGRRADPRDRHPQGDRGPPAGHPPTVPDRVVSS